MLSEHSRRKPFDLLSNQTIGRWHQPQLYYQIDERYRKIKAIFAITSVISMINIRVEPVRF